MSRRARARFDERNFELFEKIKIEVKDKEWVSLFDDMANGKFLPGFRFNKGTLIYQRNGSPSKLLLNEDPKTAMGQVQEFMRKRGVTTTIERDEEENGRVEKNNQGWCSVKSENMQEHYLNSYVDCIVYEKGLSRKDEDALRTEVFIANLNKRLNTKNVIFDEKGIKEIKGLRWDDKKFRWHIN